MEEPDITSNKSLTHFKVVLYTHRLMLILSNINPATLSYDRGHKMSLQVVKGYGA
jgi:hypothetical protein